MQKIYILAVAGTVARLQLLSYCMQGRGNSGRDLYAVCTQVIMFQFSVR